MYAHKASIFTSEELLTALIAERLDRLADRMVYRGCQRLGVYGSKAHVEWLFSHIEGMSAFPVTCLIAGPETHITSLDEHTRDGLALRSIDHPRLPELVDAVLIADDRFEDDMYQKAMRWLPPGIIIHRLYERLNIANESLIQATIDNRPKHPRVFVRPTRPASRATEAMPA